MTEPEVRPSIARDLRNGYSIKVDIFTVEAADHVVEVIDKALHDARLCGCDEANNAGYVITSRVIRDA